jgi:hypothetical protein
LHERIQQTNAKNPDMQTSFSTPDIIAQNMKMQGGGEALVESDASRITWLLFRTLAQTYDRELG